MAQRSDADLLARVAAGEERALRVLVERHSTWLLRLKRRTPDEELAASALQDTFVAVWRNAKGYRGRTLAGVARLTPAVGALAAGAVHARGTGRDLPRPAIEPRHAAEAVVGLLGAVV